MGEARENIVKRGDFDKAQLQKQQDFNVESYNRFVDSAHPQYREKVRSISESLASSAQQRVALSATTGIGLGSFSSIANTERARANRAIGLYQQEFNRGIDDKRANLKFANDRAEANKKRVDFRVKKELHDYDVSVFNTVLSVVSGGILGAFGIDSGDPQQAVGGFTNAAEGIANAPFFRPGGDFF